MPEYELSVIGAGRVASQLASALHTAGVQIRNVYSRNSEKANLLAGRLASFALSGDLATAIHSLPPKSVYLVCVADDAIPLVCQHLDVLEGLVIHTSGSVPLQHLAHSRTAVLYPLQTFSPDRPLNLAEVPFFIEASHAEVLEWLYGFAHLLSPHIKEVSSDTRQWIHLLGVISNNFINHLLVEAEQLAADHGLSFASLHPLVLETIQKAFEISPALAQTGPAARGDQTTIAKHQQLLTEQAPHLLPLYNLFTEAILKRKKE